MELLNVRDGIYTPARPHEERILGVQLRGHDTRLVLAGFEMWVREAEEEVRELPSGEVIREELHGVGAEGGDVLVRTGW